MIVESRNWRCRELYEQYAAALDQHDIACRYKISCTSIDQCALNSVFENRWFALPLSYKRLDQPRVASPAAYDVLFRLDAARKYRGDAEMRRFLKAAQTGALGASDYATQRSRTITG